MELTTLLGIYGMVVLGILISVILPILRKSLPTPPANSIYRGQPLKQRFWPIAKPYVVLGIFALISAIIIVAASGDALTDWKLALIAGFSWDSLLQKAGHP